MKWAIGNKFRVFFTVVYYCNSLADKIGNYKIVIPRKFPNTKIVELRKQARFERYMKFFQSFIRFRHSSNLLEDFETRFKNWSFILTFLTYSD